VAAAEALGVDPLDLGVGDDRQPLHVEQILQQVLERAEHAADDLGQVQPLPSPSFPRASTPVREVSPPSPRGTEAPQGRLAPSVGVASESEEPPGVWELFLV
jgi:hypothetical protein